MIKTTNQHDQNFMSRLRNGTACLAAIAIDSKNRFTLDKKGSIMPIFGVMVIPLMLIAGVALDFTRMASTKTKLSNAVDAALIQAGTMVNNGSQDREAIRQAFEAYLTANLATQNIMAQDISVESFEIDFNTGKVSASASSKVNTTLMSLANFDEMDVATTAAITVGSDPIEVSMALDVTGSMAGSKMEALQTAAKNAVDILIGDNPATSKSRVALVPYASAVNVGNTLARRISDSRSQRCVVERNGPARYNDASYSGNLFANYDYNPNYLYEGSGGRVALPQFCPTAQVQPLTKNVNQLKNQINQYRAYGGTAGHLGVAWSYYTLSSQWNSNWPNGSHAAPSSDTSTTKVAILMTDGEFNSTYNPDGEASDSIARKTCTNMKNRNIEIYSVMFTGDTSTMTQAQLAKLNAARDTLQACASPNTDKVTYFYLANSERQLVEAFEKIAQSIKRFRLVE